MTEFDVVTVRGLRKTYRSGVVAGRLGFDVQRGEILGTGDADSAGKTTTVERIPGPRRPIAIPRIRDGTRLLEQFGLGQRRRSGHYSLSGRELQRLFLVLALHDCARRTS
jgi:ABC-type multidrug transport system ATPase subunit